MSDTNFQNINERLRADLLHARKMRDQSTASILQVVIAALDNAGAVPVLHAPDMSPSAGVGSTEVQRRELTADDVQRILQSEITELQQTVKDLKGVQNSYVDELNSKVAILKKYV